MSTDITIDSLESLGHALKARRNALGWSLTEAGGRIPIAPVTLGSYERADRNPAIETLLRILKVYRLRMAVVDDGLLVGEPVGDRQDEWGVSYSNLHPYPVSAGNDEDRARGWAKISNERGTDAHLMRRTIHVGRWREVAS